MLINYNELNKKYADMTPQQISNKITEELKQYYEKKEEEDKKEKRADRARDNVNKAVNEYLDAIEASDVHKSYIKKMISYLTSKKFDVQVISSITSPQTLEDAFDRLSSIWSRF